MGSETDKLFRDRLKSLEQLPPTSAWSRVEKGVRKKRPGIIMWMNMAAAILILILGIWNQWPDKRSDQPHETAANTIEVMEKSEHQISEIKPLETHPPVAVEKTKHQVAVIKKQLQKPPFIQSEINSQIVSTSVREPIEEPVMVKDDTHVQELVAPGNITDNKSKDYRSGSTIISYSLDEVNARFLKKPKSKKANVNSPSLPEAKPNTGQKISSIAVAIKNNEVGLGDLRQFKDELLAFEFRDNDHKNTQTQDK